MLQVELMERLLKAFEQTTEPRLAKSAWTPVKPAWPCGAISARGNDSDSACSEEAQTPRGVQVERRYGLKDSEVELLRLLAGILA